MSGHHWPDAQTPRSRHPRTPACSALPGPMLGRCCDRPVRRTSRRPNRDHRRRHSCRGHRTSRPSACTRGHRPGTGPACVVAVGDRVAAGRRGCAAYGYAGTTAVARRTRRRVRWPGPRGSDGPGRHHQYWTRQPTWLGRPTRLRHSRSAPHRSRPPHRLDPLQPPQLRTHQSLPLVAAAGRWLRDSRPDRLPASRQDPQRRQAGPSLYRTPGPAGAA
jgi:hypothetical protein